MLKVEVRVKDRIANPAINSEDFKTIVDYIKDAWRPEALHPNGVHKYPLKRSWYYINLFWHYILFCKNTVIKVFKTVLQILIDAMNTGDIESNPIFRSRLVRQKNYHGHP